LKDRFTEPIGGIISYIGTNPIVPNGEQKTLFETPIYIHHGDSDYMYDKEIAQFGFKYFMGPKTLYVCEPKASHDYTPLMAKMGKKFLENIINR
jgi:hypothetical protein